MNNLDVCPFGAVCGMHGDHIGKQAHLRSLENKALDAEDTWHCVEAVLPNDVPTKYPKHYFVARGFRRKNLQVG
jgi:hypothetical protein